MGGLLNISLRGLLGLIIQKYSLFHHGLKKITPSIYELILNPEPYDFEIPGSTLTDPNYIPLANRIEQLMFKLIEVERFEKENNLILQDIDPRKEDNNGKDQLNKKE
jgi:hypothetical protein